MSGAEQCNSYLIATTNITLHDALFVNNIALCCVNSLMVILNLLANGFVVYRYYQTRSQQSISNTLLFLTASFDLLQGAVAEPLYILSCILEVLGIPHCTLSNLIYTILCIFLGFSFIMETIIITSERFFAIVYPLRHRVYLRKKVLVNLSLSLFVVWAICLAILHNLPSSHFPLIYIYITILSFGLIYTLSIYVKIFGVSRRSRVIQHREKAQPRKGALKKEYFVKEDEKFALEGMGKVYEVAVNEETGETMVNSGMNDTSGITNSNNYNIKGTAHPEDTSVTACQKILNKTQSALQTFTLTSKEKKTVFRMLCIIGVLYVTSTPVLATFAYMAVKRYEHNILVYYLFSWATTMSFSSRVITPYIYCYKNERFLVRRVAQQNSLNRSKTV